MSSTSSSAGLSLDSRSTGALQATASKDPKSAIKETAKQFESLFMNELMKSMRQATMNSGLLENQGTQLGTEMLDTQFATKMSGLKGGLGDVIARQLEKQMGLAPGSTTASTIGASDSTKPSAAAPSIDNLKIPTKQAGFVQQHSAAAQQVQAETGIPSGFMLGQAAHESGWGQREIKNADGSSSHNLFGIKAGASWTGATTSVVTTEVVNGQAHKVTAKFRAYASYADSFRDYAKLMKDNPRYQQVYAQAAATTTASAAGAGTATTASVSASAAKFAKGLQNAGYATDPAYADKLTRVINTALRLQRTSA